MPNIKIKKVGSEQFLVFFRLKLGFLEDEIPTGMEMYGIIAMVEGSKKDLGGKTEEELMEYIEEHGGQTDNEYQDDTTCLISTKNELKKKKKKSAKVKAALDNELPILSPDFVYNLCERKEEGLKLRDKKVAEKYLLEGKFGDKFAKKYIKERVEKEKEQEKQAKEEEERKKRKRVRPQPKAGSDILKVDPEETSLQDYEILVTHDDDHG